MCVCIYIYICIYIYVYTVYFNVSTASSKGEELKINILTL